MSNSNSSSASSGIGFLSLLSGVFITLKLMGVINWSWWLVTAPLWAGWVLIFFVLVIWFGISLMKGKT